MLRSYFTFLGRLYLLVVSLLLSVGLGIVAWGCWQLYEDEREMNLFLNEGRLVSVKIEETSLQQQSWRDLLGNTSYLTFYYHNKTYIARFVRDTVFVSTGDRVSLLYHPGLGAFRQPGHQLHFKEAQGRSRLIRWTMVSTFSTENRWLVLCLMISGFFFLYTCGVLANFTGWGFFGAIGRMVFTILLLGGAVFFTIDSWEYYRYYQHLKTNGQQRQVKVLDTDRSAYSSRQSRYWEWYWYTARVQLDGQERAIPLEEADYEALKPGDALSVLYDKALDDLMPVGYSLDYRQWLVAAFLWLFSGLFIWKKGWGPAANTSGHHP